MSGRATEKWLPVPGYEGLYEVSDQGNIRSLWFGKRRSIRPSVSGAGYRTLWLCRPGHKERRGVAVCVLEAFVGPRPPGFQAAHEDGNTEHNALSNLAWKTAASNAADRDVHGTCRRGARHQNAKLTESAVFAIRQDDRPHRLIAADYGVNQTTVSQIKRRKAWTHV